MRRTFTLASRAAVLAWVLSISGVVVLALIIWLAGGFRPAPNLSGPAAELGQPLELRRWTVVVHRVSLVDTSLQGFEREPAFRVRATVTLRDRATVPTLPELIEVRVPDGPQPGRASSQDWTRGQQLDPDVPRPMVLDFRWPDSDGAAALPAPDRVAVVVHDEIRARSYLYGRDWATAPPAGVITVPVEDRRERS
jgi:hypothetical protein